MEKISNAKFKRFGKEFADQRSIFRTYKRTVFQVLDCASEIKQYIAIKCSNGHEKMLKPLDEIQRDIRIFHYRISQLDVKLKKCASSIRSAVKKRDTIFNAECLEIFIKWHQQRGEFHRSFKTAQDKWKETEENILNLVDPIV